MKDPRPKVDSRTAFNQRNIYQPSETSQPTELSGSVYLTKSVQRLTLSEHGEPFAVNSGCSAAMSPVATPTLAG